MKLKNIYYNILVITLPTTTTIGFIYGMKENINNNKNNIKLLYFTNIVGYTSIGITTGLFYPVSYPLLGYSLYKKN